MIDLNWKELKEQLSSEAETGYEEKDFQVSAEFADAVIAWADALDRKGSRDGNEELSENAGKLKRAVLMSVEALGAFQISDNTCKEDMIADLYERFLDARSVREKREILQKLRPNLTNKMINDFAVILDVIVADSDYIDDRYYSLMRCLDTMAKFETTGLR